MTESLMTQVPTVDMAAAFERWRRACTQVADAMVKAGLAQAELTRGLIGAVPSDFEIVRAGGSPVVSGQALMQAAHARMLNTVDGWRRANDALLAGLFAAAETLTQAAPETMPDGVAAKPVARPAARQAA